MSPSGLKYQNPVEKNIADHLSAPTVEVRAAVKPCSTGCTICGRRFLEFGMVRPLERASTAPLEAYDLHLSSLICKELYPNPNSLFDNAGRSKCLVLTLK